VKKRQASIYNEEYQGLISRLIVARKAKGITQQELAKRIGFAQHDISKVESCVRRLDVLELRDWLRGIEIKDDLLKQITRILSGNL
jgi:transcriptional regulator with XRE-family HTH domain